MAKHSFIHKLKRVKPVTWVLAVAVLFSISSIAVYALSPNSSLYSPTTQQIAQLGSQSAQFTVFDINGNYLGKSSQGAWSGPAADPKVECWTSQPYLSYSNGSPVAGNSQALTPAGNGAPVMLSNGNFAYIDTCFVTVRVAARTLWQEPSFSVAPIPLSPFQQQQFSWNGGLGTVSHTFSCAQTKGVLAFGTTAASWSMNSAGQFYITQSLEPVTFDIGTGNTFNSSVLSESQAINNLEYGTGNARVVIEPSFNIQAITNEIQSLPFSYNTTLSNGTVVTTTVVYRSADAGFTLVPTQSGTQTCTIPNVNLQQVPASFDASSTNQSANNVQTASVDGTSPQTSEGGYQVTASVQYKNYNTYVATVQSPKVYTSTSSIDGKQVTVIPGQWSTNCGMPNNVTVTTKMELQPQTTVYEANTQVNWDGVVIGGDGFTSPVYTSGSAIVHYPVGIFVLNTAASTDITFPMTVVTNNSVQTVFATGTPGQANVKNLNDTDLNGVYTNPMADDQNTTLNYNPPNAGLGSLFSGLGSALDTFLTIVVWIAVTIIIVLVVVAIAWVASKFHRH
jgi:hypothetical protein